MPEHQPPPYHGPYLGPSFALLVALLGVALLVMVSALAA